MPKGSVMIEPLTGLPASDRFHVVGVPRDEIELAFTVVMAPFAGDVAVAEIRHDDPCPCLVNSRPLPYCTCAEVDLVVHILERPADA